jgi:23S rRNA (cytosine1962-C5)-methyltransferase
MYPIVELRKGKEVLLGRKHPWIFSGAIYRAPKEIEDGSLVWVSDSKGEIRATGHYFKGSIAVRILSFEKLDKVDVAFWKQRLESAWNLRKVCGLIRIKETTAFRWIHGEGDMLPGLIVDYYNGHLVIESHSSGMELALPDICEAAKGLLGEDLKSIFHKRRQKSQGEGSEWLYGEASETTILEHGISFVVNWETGQKTGFFLDQRPNRKLIKAYAQGRSVLNTFGYSGGFAIAALKAGAKRAVNLDISAAANDLAMRNLALNGFTDSGECVTADCFDYLKDHAAEFDLIVLDPPAFAKNLRARHKAVIGYKRLNEMAMSRIPKGGLIFTFSCSQVIDRQLFRDTIVAAGIESGRQVQILHELSQGPDHPVNLFHPEGSYLKGLVLLVD